MPLTVEAKLTITQDALTGGWVLRGWVDDLPLTDEQMRLLGLGAPTDRTAWAFPVGELGYPVEDWYVATFHGPNANYRSNFHTGLDINLAKFEYGDVERRLGLSVYAVAAGQVTHTTPVWGEGAGGMLVLKTEWQQRDLWVRYAHVTPVVKLGDWVLPGQKLGGFADYKNGDHLHFDMALDEFDRHWCTEGIDWIDPLTVLRDKLDPASVEAMLTR